MEKIEVAGILKSRRGRKSTIAIYVVLVFFFLLWLAPIGTAVRKSFSVNGIDNYLYVLNYEKINYFQVIGNSFFIAAITAVVVVILTTLGSYAFSKMHFTGKNVLYYMLLSCLAIPIASVTVPLFFTVKNLGLMDSFSGIILPMVAFNAPLMLMMVKNYFDGVPDELLEAARIDGCGTFRIYRMIMMPLSVPVIANVAVLTFVYTWNEYLVPLLVIRSEAKYTVTLASRHFMETTYQSPSNVAQLYAALILMTIPSVIIYLFSQRYLQSGITAGAIKS